jgi:trimethylamine--corrinoid protein Co-methyltransferase
VLSQLSQRYNLPVFGTAGCSDSKIVDEQAAIEAAFSLLFTALVGTNIIHDVGYLGSGMCGALDFLIMGDEMAEFTRRILKGIRIDREAIALDLIDKVGPGGHFTGEHHTLQHFKTATWYPKLLDRNNYTQWKAKGGKTLRQRCIEEAKRILTEHEVEPLPKETSRELTEILTKMEHKIGN